MEVAQISVPTGYNLNTILHNVTFDAGNGLTGISESDAFHFVIDTANPTAGSLFLTPEALNLLNNATDTINFTIHAAPSAGAPVLSYSVPITVGDLDQSLNAGADGQTIEGFLGNDILDDAAFNDVTLNGGNGTDYLNVTGTGATADGGAGDDDIVVAVSATTGSPPYSAAVRATTRSMFSLSTPSPVWVSTGARERTRFLSETRSIFPAPAATFCPASKR